LLNGENLRMGRYRHQLYSRAKTPRYCVIFNLQWQILESVELEPSADLAAALAAAIARQSTDGWQAEGEPEFGFVFLRRETERRLLILTARDPYDRSPQSFSPFTHRGTKVQ
jgi:hypothetical protein